MDFLQTNTQYYNMISPGTVPLLQQPPLKLQNRSIFAELVIDQLLISCTFFFFLCRLCRCPHLVCHSKHKFPLPRSIYQFSVQFLFFEINTQHLKCCRSNKSLAKQLLCYTADFFQNKYIGNLVFGCKFESRSYDSQTKFTTCKLSYATNNV